MTEDALALSELRSQLADSRASNARTMEDLSVVRAEAAACCEQVAAPQSEVLHREAGAVEARSTIEQQAAVAEEQARIELRVRLTDGSGGVCNGFAFPLVN